MMKNITGTTTMKNIVTIFVISLAFLTLTQCQKPGVVQIAAIGNWNTAVQQSYLNFTMFVADYLNNRTDLLSNVSITLVPTNVGTDQTVALLDTVQLALTNSVKVIALLGGSDTTTQQIISQVAGAVKVVHMGGVETVSAFSDKTLYPYFMRTIPANSYMPPIMAKFIAAQKWKNVMVVYQDSVYGKDSQAAFATAATANGLVISLSQVVATGTVSASSYTSYVSKVKAITTSKIIVFFCESTEGSLWFAEAKKQGIIGADYAFLSGEVYYRAATQNSTTINNTLADGMIAFTSSIHTNPLRDDMWAAWLAADPTVYVGSRAYIAREAWFFVEGLYALAKGLDSLLAKSYSNINVKGSTYLAQLRALNYAGPSGNVSFDTNGDRIIDVEVYNVAIDGVGAVTSTTAQTYTNGTFTSVVPLRFYGGNTNAAHYQPVATAITTITVGVVGDWDLPGFSNYYNFTKFFIYFVNSNTTLFPNFTIAMTWANSGADSTVALTSGLSARSSTALFGGPGTVTQQSISLLATALKVVHFNGVESSNVFTDKTSWPYFIRTVPTNSYLVPVIIRFIISKQWKNVVLVYQDTTYGTDNQRAFQAAGSESAIYTTAILLNTGATNFSQQVEKLRTSGATIVVMLCEYPEGALFLQELDEAGLIDDKYVYLLGEEMYEGSKANDTLYDGMIGFTPAIDVNNVTTSLQLAWDYANTTQWPGARDQPIPRRAWFFIEGIFCVAAGAKSMLAQNYSVSPVNGTLFYNELRKLNYTGITGRVSFDANGDRIMDSDIISVRKDSTTGITEYNLAQRFDPRVGAFSTISEVTYYGGTVTPPLDTVCSCAYGYCDDTGKCICDDGYNGAACDVKQIVGGDNGISSQNLGVAIAIPVVVVAGIVVAALFLYRKKRLAMVKELADKQRSELSRSSIQLVKKIGRGASGEVYTALLRGTTVAVKRLPAANVTAAAIQQFKLESAMMCGLRHPNIILFMGTCYDKQSKEFLLVMEHMARGSLFDVLYNKNVNLTTDLQLHLAYQIVQGINYLHLSTPPIVHCDIKSHNVLLDDKWHCRISDFGITIASKPSNPLKKKSTNSATDSEQPLGTVYWSAPEVLNGGPHTTNSDTYAVGMVLWEIFHRQLPYGGRDPLQVALEVVKVGKRPEISPTIPPKIQDLIKSCWDQDPNSRPAMQDVVMTLLDLTLETPAHDFGDKAVALVPTGIVFFVITDVDDAEEYWDRCPKDMQDAMKQHNQLLRELLEVHKGYEVGFKGHSFTAAFAKASDAFGWCTAVQQGLLDVIWPYAISSSKSGSKVTNMDGTVIWRGLRVKMVVHKGIPKCVQDRFSQKMNYEGPVCDKLKTLIHFAPAGVVTLSQDVANFVRDSRMKMDLAPYRQVLDKSTNEQETLQLMSASTELTERLLTVMRPNTGNGADSAREKLPYSVIDLEDHDSLALTPSSRNLLKSAHKWIIDYESLTVKEIVGTSACADVHIGTLEGSEVAIKVLINQNFSEDNYFTLKYLGSTLVKLQHPNILRFIGACVEAPHIALITEYMAGGALQKFTMSNEPFSFDEKVKVALGIAKAMKFLCDSDDPTMGINAKLTSNNVLLGKRGEVKLSDFASAKLYDSNRTITSVASGCWTAPELLEGEENASLATAVYSYAIILWEMYTRKKPFEGIHPIRLLSTIMEGYRMDIPADCPVKYANLIRSCWVANPSERPSWQIIISTLESM